jgi:hypothetical protein
VQGVMEPSYRGRSYLGKTMRVEGRVSKFFFPIHPNLRDKIHFKGGRFVTTCFFKKNRIL